MKNTIEKLTNTKNELIQQIKQKDIAILELSKYYEGENKITYFNEKIRQHQELCKKYDLIKNKMCDEE